MSIKLTLLKSGETLISEMKELVAEDTEQAHAYLLENPHKVETREKSFLTEEEKDKLISFLERKVQQFNFS